MVAADTNQPVSTKPTGIRVHCESKHVGAPMACRDDVGVSIDGAAVTRYNALNTKTKDNICNCCLFLCFMVFVSVIVADIIAFDWALV